MSLTHKFTYKTNKNVYAFMSGGLPPEKDKKEHLDTEHKVNDTNMADRTDNRKQITQIDDDTLVTGYDQSKRMLKEAVQLIQIED